MDGLESNNDLSDDPVLPFTGERPFIKNPFYHPTKSQITLRLDADLLAWAKEGGAGYQTRINSILRAAFVRHRLKELHEKTEAFLKTKAIAQGSRKPAASVSTPRARRMGAKTRPSSASLGQQQSTAAKRRS